MKEFGPRISYIIMRNTSTETAKTKIEGCVKYLFRKCEPGDGWSKLATNIPTR